MTTGKSIGIERKEGIGTITFGRPESLNVLDTSSLMSFRDALEDLGRDDGIKVLIITGKTHFCAGADIRELKGKEAGSAQVFAELGHSVCDRIENMEKPVIAAVSGYALGAGCEIALSCDIRIASGDAKFGQPEVSLGLIPGFGGTQRLTRLVGIGTAKEIILTGRFVGPEEAHSIGLINSVAGEDELLVRAEDMARLLAQKGPVALKLAKRLMNENHRIGGELEMEIAFFADCFKTDDHLEGINAFLEKRRPKFKGS
ncbi:MAG: enoyl-CoA hydratase-related protein [Candidatus Sulfobium sp.]